MAGFGDIIGQERAKEHLKKAVRTGRISHAYIISGEKGMGKRMLADAFAMTLLCERDGDAPCGECHSCRQFLAGSHPDVILVTHQKPNTISVDEIREQVSGTVDIRPFSSEKKIYLIEEAEKMTVQAQNALLKTLEEPPAYAVFLLLSANADSFLPTVLSRCVNLPLRPLTDQQVTDMLEARLGLPEKRAEVFAAFSRGNPGKALACAESEDFEKLSEGLLNILTNIKEMDIAMILDAIKALADKPAELNECLDFMELWYRDVLMYKVTMDPNGLTFKGEFPAIRKVVERSSYEGLEKILSAIQKARARLQANVNREIALELMLLVMKEN